VEVVTLSAGMEIPPPLSCAVISVSEAALATMAAVMVVALAAMVSVVASASAKVLWTMLTFTKTEPAANVTWQSDGGRDRSPQVLVATFVFREVTAAVESASDA
jgi:hypothetical protein